MAIAEKSATRTRTFGVRNLTKVFGTDGGPVKAVDNVSFEISGDTFFTMLGPSGCGKTTTLRMIAGLEAVTSGQIVSDGADYGRMNAFQRNIGMVFQSYALFPHMTVFENTAYGLRLRKVAEPDIDKAVARILSMLQLEGLARRYPADLSGGQQQRVSIARALVYEPGMLLLDEPLANLDAKLRVEMREEIRGLQKSLGIMALYVTHDQEEAMAVSDTIAVFNSGRLMQQGRPVDVYSSPGSLFVADFIGKANFFPVTIDRLEGGKTSVRTRSGLRLEGMPIRPAAPGEESWFTDCDAVAMVRPGRMWLAPATPQTDVSQSLAGRVRRVQFLGTFVRYLLESACSPRQIIIDAPALQPGIEEGSEASFGFEVREAILFGKPAS